MTIAIISDIWTAITAEEPSAYRCDDHRDANAMIIGRLSARWCHLDDLCQAWAGTRRNGTAFNAVWFVYEGAFKQ